MARYSLMPSASEFVQSLARGISVVRSFSADAPRQTLSDVARSTGLTRATARRILLTLEELGYVRSNGRYFELTARILDRPGVDPVGLGAGGRYFELTARILDIGYSYVASLNLNEIAQPFLESFSEVVREPSSVSVLDDTDIVYIARVPTKRIMTVAIGLGSRFPAFQTSMGRVLLAEQDDDEVLELFRRSDRSQTTEYTVTSGKALLEQLHEVRQHGWSLVD